MTMHSVVSRQEWLEARMALLAKEKALTRQHDALARERMQLPWECVVTAYAFDTPEGTKTLAELFGDKSQLLVYHFMFGPEWEQGCPSCSLAADSMNANYIHLIQRDVSFAMVSRAPMAKIAAFKKRMGWSVPWVSSFDNGFNYDYGVSLSEEERQGKVYNYGSSTFPSDEAPGMSAFYKDERGMVYHTYSGYARSLESLLGVYTMLDVAPLGRNEDGLAWPMAWVRHHDRYEPQAAKHEAACCSAVGN